MSDGGIGDFTRGSDLVLGEPVPEGRRPLGRLAWLVGIAVWVAVLGLLGLLFWLLS